MRRSSSPSCGDAVLCLRLFELLGNIQNALVHPLPADDCQSLVQPVLKAVQLPHEGHITSRSKPRLIGFINATIKVFNLTTETLNFRRAEIETIPCGRFLRLRAAICALFNGAQFGRQFAPLGFCAFAPEPLMNLARNSTAATRGHQTRQIETEVVG
jgi:hypothetical protein